MRILHVIPSLIRGGAERLLLNLAGEQDSAGHEVQIFVLHDDNKYESLNSKIKIELTPARVSYSLLSKDISETSAFDYAVTRFKPDVIHSHLIEAEIISRHKPYKKAVYVSHWHGCPEMLRKHPFKDYLKKDTWWSWNTKRNLVRAYRECNNHFLCISDFMQAFVVEHLDTNPENCTVIANAVDTNLFQPTAQSTTSTPLQLIALGKLNHNKNQQFLVRVVAELLKLGIEAEISLLGSGKEEAALSDLAQELGVSDKIKFLGTVPNPEVYLNSADILIHSAHYEAFGLVLLEAMACGKPVVCFNDGGPSEVVRNGINGFSTPRNNLKQFTEAVASLALDNELYSEMSVNALRFSQDFGLNQYATKVQELYEKLLQQRSSNL